MQIPLSSSWQSILSDEIQQPYFQDLMETVAEEYKNHTCFNNYLFMFGLFYGKLYKS